MIRAFPVFIEKQCIANVPRAQSAAGYWRSKISWKCSRAVLGLGLVALAGCGAGGNIEQDFLCSAQSGQPCRSISEVDGAAGTPGGSLKEDLRDTQAKSLTQDPIFMGKKTSSAVAGIPGGGTPYVSARYRIPEKTGKIWIAPYLDEANILHEGTHVHVVLRDARWGTR